MRRRACDLRLLDCIAEDEIVLPVCGMPFFAHEHGDLCPVPGAVQDDVSEKLAPAASDGLSAASGDLVLLCQLGIICRFGKRTQLKLGFRRDPEDASDRGAVELLPFVFPSSRR